MTPERENTKVLGTSVGEHLAPVTDEELPLQSLYRWESQRPNDVYMIQPLGGGRLREYTWGRTVDEARRLATYLKAKNYGHGACVAMVSKNCAQHFIFEMAAWMAGYVTVSVFPTVDPKTLDYILTHAECSLVFVGKLDDWPAMAGGVKDSIEILSCDLSPEISNAVKWEDVLAQNEPMAGNPVRDKDDTAMLIYTSGSTGMPKGVEHSFAAGTYTGRAMHHLVTYTRGDRMLSYLPLAHVLERCIVFMPSMIHGFQVHFVESLDTFVQDLKRARPTIFASVPRLWLKFKAGVDAKMPPKRLDLLLKLPIISGIVKKKVLSQLGLDAVRVCGTGSAPLPTYIHGWYLKLGLEFLDSLGMSETMGLMSLSRPGKAKPGTVGPALPGTELRISEEGEIQVKNPGVMKGYFKQPELTAETFTEDGWLKTGDQGAIDADGLLRITGRVKELFKTGKGKYVAPAPIEGMFNATDLIEQSCVMGVGEPMPFVVVMLNDQARAAYGSGGQVQIREELEKVFNEVNAKLAKYERLSKLVVTGDSWEIANGLLTPTMKIKRTQLESQYHDRAKALGTGVVSLEATA